MHVDEAGGERREADADHVRSAEVGEHAVVIGQA
jgi:hypothetical protein